MKIEKDAENILNKFSKTLENIPDLEETWYITDNLNLTREDKSHEKHPEKIPLINPICSFNNKFAFFINMSIP